MKASRAVPHRWAPTGWSAARAALCLNSISTKKKKKFVSLAALSLLAGVLAGCPSSASCVRVRSQLTSDRAHLSVQQAINV